MPRDHLIVIACAGFVISACTQHELLGVWESVDTGEGSYYFGHYAYLEDGRKCSVLFEYVDSEVETVAFINRWQLDGDILTLTYGPSNSSIAEGYSSRSRVEQLTASRYVYRIIDSAYAEGEIEVNIRLPDVDPYRVCALAYEILGRSEDAPSDTGRT